MNGLSVLETIETFLQTHQLWGQWLIIGVSGGADSLTLLHGLRAVGCEEITVVHVDHGLRESSAEDARHVQKICDEWNIPCIIKQLALTNDSEETARAARYRALSTVAQMQGATAILTAHHADDQVETVLMNIVRGTGVDGLSGMSAVAPVPYAVIEGQRLYRPILTLPRNKVITYCQQNNIPFVIDPTNQETRYFRNRVRHEILPSLEQHAPQIRKRLLQLAEVSSADSALLHTLTKEAYADLLVATGKQWRELDLMKWRVLSLALRRRTLRYVLHTLDTTLTDVGFAVIEEARGVAESGHVGQKAALPNGWWLTVGYGRVVIGAKDSVPPLDVPQIFGEQILSVPGRVALGEGWEISAEIVARQERGSLKEPRSSLSVYIPYREKLTLRGRHVGERMHPFGASGSAKLKRIMIDRKIPQRVRANWPLVVVEDQIVWVVGEVLGEIGRIPPDADKCIRLQLTHNISYAGD